MYSKLNNYYWQIRYTRIKAVRRKYYRYIAKEEKRLIDSGVDAEELRLLCRHLSNLRNEQAEIRLEAYRKTLKTCRTSSLI
jgi:hypothetical protein